MVYAIISDVHANLAALERVLADSRRCGAERFVFLGDIAGIGPEPEKTLARVREVATIILRGDYDDHTNLPLTARLAEATFVHGDITDPSAFKRIDSCAAASANFAANDATILFVGHTHVPQLYLTGRSGEVYSLRAQDFVLESERRYIVDVGSVGYPQETEGKYHSSYVLYDDSARSVVFRRLPFDVGSLIGKDNGRTKNPKALIRIAFFLGVAAVLSIMTAVTWSRSKSVSIPLKNESKTEAAVNEVRELKLTAGEKRVHANLTLDRKSDAVRLEIVFFDANGNNVKALRETVRSFSKKGFAVPNGTSVVRFTVASEKTDGIVVIRTFEPTAE